MPNFDPRAPYYLSLDCFADVPEKDRPSFQFRRVNGAEYLKLESVWDFANQRTSEVRGQLLELFQIGLIGWRNQFDPATGEEIPFEPARLEEVINHVEAFELIQKRLTGARVNGTDLKNSESQS